MKGINYAIAIVAILALFSFSEQNNESTQVIAYVDGTSIINQMPEFKRAKIEVEAYGKQLSKVLEEKEEEIQIYYGSILEKVQKGLLTPTEQQKAEANLNEKQEQLNKYATDADEELIKKENELTQPVYDKFKNALNKVAIENNYSYIFDANSLLYSKGGIDASNQVKAVLGF